jgi:hypothetical protein
MINYSAVARESKSGFTPTQNNWQLQMRPSEKNNDGLISCEYLIVILKQFVIGGECADSKSNGPQGPQK